MTKLEKDTIIMSHKGLVISIASKYHPKFLTKDDLINEGYVGLIKAMNNYNLEGKAKFSSYAYFYIRGEILKAIRYYDGIFKFAMPNNIEHNKRIMAYKESLQSISLDEPMLKDEEGGTNRENLIFNTRRELFKKDFSAKIDVEYLLSFLTPDQQKAIKLRLGGLKEDEVAKKLKMSFFKTHHLINRGLKKIEKILKTMPYEKIGNEKREYFYKPKEDVC